MNSWSKALHSHWYAIALSDRLCEHPTAVTVLDQHIVVARLSSGRLLALEDRCPHRQAPLSAGHCTRSGITCPYHGWTFNAEGELTELPGALPGSQPPPVRARAFDIQEHDGIAWIRLSKDGEVSLNGLIQQLKPRHRRFLWHTTWQANIVDAMENFLDPLHTHEVHPGLVRRNNNRCRTKVQFRREANGFTVDYLGQSKQSGLLFRLFESARTVERAHFAAPGSTQIEYRYVNGGIVSISLHFTPRTSELTDVFATLHVEGRWAPAWAVSFLVWPFLRRVSEQDRRILKLQSDNMKRFPSRSGASTQLDIVRSTLEQFWRGDEIQASNEFVEVEMML